MIIPNLKKWCQEKCLESDFMFYGLQSGQACWCGDRDANKIGTAPQAECDRDCPDLLGTEKCGGGDSRRNVFATVEVDPVGRCYYSLFKNVCMTSSNFKKHIFWFVFQASFERTVRFTEPGHGIFEFHGNHSSELCIWVQKLVHQ